MSGASEAVQAALVAALNAHAPLADAIHGLFDRPPPRAPFPYAGIGVWATGDAGHKTGSGREHRLTVSLWDDGASASRLHRLMAEAETAIEAMARDLDGHRLVSLAFLRSRVVRYGNESCAGIIDYRARTLAT
ncbi:MAG TPA: DUF3168 domain-containing protein [Sphingomonadaceae bacterium]|nr:DUF3168 domain-containing protein [Sphingomonadaceae bacterium]